MKFIRQNKTFIICIIFLFTVFGILQFLSCSSENNLEQLNRSISKENGLKSSISEELSLFNGLDRDYELSTQDLQNLSQIEKEQQRFWKNILNPTENIFINWKKKTPESINADLTRMYTNLRDLCRRNNVVFAKQNNTQTFGFGNPQEDNNEKYGFGFSTYDGFWPSFTVKEAKDIGIQSKIISNLVEYVADSSDENYGIQLIRILRESVGNEDAKHIAGDSLNISNLERKLVRFKDGVKSFAFLIEFKCHTSHARSFINQLRPPFLLRDLKVEREIESKSISSLAPLQNNPFGEGSVSIDDKPLPIVQNVESTFTFLLEYPYEVNRDLESYLINLLENEDVDSETLSKFLEESGNSKLNSNLSNLFEKK